MSDTMAITVPKDCRLPLPDDSGIVAPAGDYPEAPKKTADALIEAKLATLKTTAKPKG
ncbi:MAG: hypothetical protein ACFBZ9_03615 [Sphingomonadales bacterium]